MSNLAKIFKYDPATMYLNGADTRVEVASTDQFGCNGGMTLTDCQIRGIALDDVNQKVYYSYVNQDDTGMIATQLRRMNKDGSGDTLLYKAVYYERSGRGPWDAQYFGSFTVDLVNRDFYVSTYKGNSEERSIIRLTMDPEPMGRSVYLYGHPSIRHSLIAANVHAPYEGPSDFSTNSSFEIVVPKYGMTRYYGGSVPIAVVPGLSRRNSADDPLSKFFAKVHGSIPVSERSGVTISCTGADPSPMQTEFPDGVSCAGGYVAYSSSLYDMEGLSLPIADCATRCLAVDGCESFNFGGAGRCYLYNDIIRGVSGLRNQCEIEGYGTSGGPDCTQFSGTMGGYFERRVDRACVASDTWSPWSFCDDMGSCGVGTQNRTRDVVQPSRGRGAACASLLEYRHRARPSL
jgi:hypothetical protein